MIHITLGSKVAADRDDALGRGWVGFDESMTDAELYEASRGCWVLGSRADDEKHALVSFAGKVRQAIEIDQIELIPSCNRRALRGAVLRPGHPVYDRYVGKPSPVVGVRNPITYFDDEDEQRTCACGCDVQPAPHRDFVPGHDQRAVHERIARVGTVKDFLAWFDAVHREGAGR